MYRLRMATVGSLVIAAAFLGRSAVGSPAREARAASAAEGAVPAPVVGAADDDGLRKLLDEVHRRSADVQARARELDQRAVALEALEQAVDQAVSDLEARDGGPGASPCKLRGGVARIYENMRAEDAAAILDQLDDDTLRVVFARMEAKRVAAVMAAMSRERAVAFTRVLAADPDAPAKGLARP